MPQPFASPKARSACFECQTFLGLAACTNQQRLADSAWSVEKGIRVKVWIDSDLCTGVALCERSCPEVFVMANDGLAHVKGPDGQMQPGGTAVPFADSLLDSVLEAAEDCPEECIFIDA